MRNLPISTNEAQLDLATKDMLAHEMVVHLNVLCASMINRVLDELDVAEVVTIDGNQFCNHHLKVPR